jgi:hypothetical protein
MKARKFIAAAMIVVATLLGTGAAAPLVLNNIEPTVASLCCFRRP